MVSMASRTVMISLRESSYSVLCTKSDHNKATLSIFAFPRRRYDIELIENYRLPMLLMADVIQRQPVAINCPVPGIPDITLNTVYIKVPNGQGSVEGN